MTESKHRAPRGPGFDTLTLHAGAATGPCDGRPCDPYLSIGFFRVPRLGLRGGVVQYGTGRARLFASVESDQCGARGKRSVRSMAVWAPSPRPAGRQPCTWRWQPSVRPGTTSSRPARSTAGPTTCWSTRCPRFGIIDHLCRPEGSFCLRSCHHFRDPVAVRRNPR